MPNDNPLTGNAPGTSPEETALLSDKEQQRLRAKFLRDYYRDGTLAMSFGIAMLALAGLWAADVSSRFILYGVIVAIGLVAALFLPRWQRRVVYPRLGYAERLKPRAGAGWRMLGLVLVIQIGAHFLLKLWESLAVMDFPGPLSTRRMILQLLVTAVGFLALDGGLKIFIAVAPLTLLYFVLTEVLHFDLVWPIALTGLSLIALGLWQLRRFLRDYPVLEAADGP